MPDLSKTTSGNLDKAIGETITSLSTRMDEELYVLTEAELFDQWYFKWDDRGGPAWNFYKFNEMLEIHKRRCRRWETHHHGSMCVVERVRDKYLMPRIKAFMVELSERSATSHG